ncbi:MAG: LysR family transcriptional regulator substrate-binding protein [Acidobacteria bacterium]|nr:LysR family transcriptional regulator substrate-binding protein [Acidobacteriota bacterium]
MRLSQAGKIALGYVERILDETESLRERISGRERALAGRVKAAAATQAFVGRERLIMFERGASIRRTTEDFLKRAEIAPAFALESNDTYFIKLMVEHGVGVSFLPSWAVREETEAGRIAALRVEGHSLRRAVAMLSLGRLQPSPTRAFLAFMQRHRETLQEAALPAPARAGGDAA